MVPMLRSDLTQVAKFATTANGIYADSILLTGYGANFNIGLYTQVRTDSVADYSGIIPVMGGGDTLGINIVAVIVNSSPSLILRSIM